MISGDRKNCMDIFDQCYFFYKQQYIHINHRLLIDYACIILTKTPLQQERWKSTLQKFEGNNDELIERYDLPKRHTFSSRS